MSKKYYECLKCGEITEIKNENKLHGCDNCDEDTGNGNILDEKDVQFEFAISTKIEYYYTTTIKAKTKEEAINKFYNKDYKQEDREEVDSSGEEFEGIYLTEIVKKN